MKRTPLKRKTQLRSRTTLNTSVRGKSSPTRAKKKSLAKWKKELDSVFSKYIRKRDGGQCFTCPKKDDPKHMQNGHFVPRQYLSLRFDERNCHCQCYACNMLYNGQPSMYAIRLKEKYGDSIIQELENVRLKETKLDENWYREKIAYYRALLVE